MCYTQSQITAKSEFVHIKLIFMQTWQSLEDSSKRNETMSRRFLPSSFISIAATIFFTVTAAHSEETAKWTGEGAFSAGNTTGNTETSDYGLALKLGREGEVWTHAVEAAADFGKTNGIETQNRLYTAYQLDRKINDKLSAWGRGSWEKDEFSGYNSRSFVGAGLGYIAVDNEQTKWVLSGGSGVKFDDPITGSSETSIAFRAGSRFSHAFNDNVTFSNDTDVISASSSTQLANTTAVTAKLMEKLSARFSFEVRHDTSPPPAIEKTDTATRISLVYAIGS